MQGFVRGGALSLSWSTKAPMRCSLAHFTGAECCYASDGRLWIACTSAPAFFLQGRGAIVEMRCSTTAASLFCTFSVAALEMLQNLWHLMGECISGAHL